MWLVTKRECATAELMDLLDVLLSTVESDPFLNVYPMEQRGLLCIAQPVACQILASTCAYALELRIVCRSAALCQGRKTKP